MRPPTIAGLLIVIVAAATIGGIWVFGSAEDPPTESAAAASTEPPEGPTARLALTSNLYALPSRTSDLVAIVPEGRSVRVTGRTDDSAWLRVIYPVTSTLEGWVPISHVMDASTPPIDEIPEVASIATADSGETAGLNDEPALPDLTVSSADVGANGILSVRITNLGRATFAGTVGLRVTTAEGEIIGSLDADLAASPLGPGRSAAVNTGVLINTTRLYVIEVDPSDDVEEASEFNNSRRVLLVGLGQ
ncbi:MAG: hypothetical protein O2924_03695 [Chloroflexi bacterium]|nr:hypothetical protein [Chloroflexota bacterium]MQC17084.1 hypothetical protein [Chloroflexota bacterium]